MKVLMFYENDPAGLANVRQHFPAHRARLDAFHKRGVLLMAGAEEFVKDDPFVVHGIVARYQFQEWNAVLDG